MKNWLVSKVVPPYAYYLDASEVHDFPSRLKVPSDIKVPPVFVELHKWIEPNNHSIEDFLGPKRDRVPSEHPKFKTSKLSGVAVGVVLRTGLVIVRGMRSRGSFRVVLDGLFLLALKRYSLSFQRLSGVQPMPLVGFLGDTISNYLLTGKYYEQDELNRVFHFLESRDAGVGKVPSGTAIDMGANIGNHTLYLQSRFEKVLSFEPHPDIYRLLEINTRQYPNVSCYNFGLSSSPKAQRIFSFPGNMGASSLVNHHGQKNSISVNLRPLDEIVEDSTKIALMKIDVEGSELQALIGSTSVISRDSPVILIERSLFDGSFEKSNESLAWLERNGYTFFWEKDSSKPRNAFGRVWYLMKRWTVGNLVKWTSGWPPEREISLVVALKEGLLK